MARIGGFGVNGSEIYLNVYDLDDNNAILYPWGLGFYHSGVQVGREEYTFAGQAGIFSHEPKGAPPPAKFRESIPLGVFKGTSRDLEAIVQSLRSKFGGNDYHLLNNNCNCFANEFVQRLTGQEIPGWVNRMASIGSYFSCLLPEQSATDAPVNASSSDSSTTSFYTRGGRAEINKSNPYVNTSSVGRKLGDSGGGGSSGSEVNTVSEILMEDRREKMRAAATKRFSSSSSSSFAL